MSRFKSKKSISYARSARENARGIAAQHAAKRAAAAANRDSSVEEVSDHRGSGLSSNRPVLVSILVRAEAGQLAGARLYVAGLDRLDRSLLDVLRKLADLGVEVVDSSSVGCFDAGTTGVGR